MLKKILIITPIIFFLLIATVVILHWQTDIVSDLSKDLLNSNLGEVAHFEYSSLTGDLLKNMVLKDLKITFTSVEFPNTGDQDALLPESIVIDG